MLQKSSNGTDTQRHAADELHQMELHGGSAATFLETAYAGNDVVELADGRQPVHRLGNL